MTIQFFKRDETESHLIEEEVIDLNDLLLYNEESVKNTFEKGTSVEKKSIEILDRVILSTCSNEELPRDNMFRLGRSNQIIISEFT